jgi:hypothetical protein
LAAGFFFGVVMGTVCFFLVHSVDGLAWRVLLSIFAGLFCGVGFGRSFPLRLRKRMSLIIDRLYASDTEIDTPPPPEKDLRYRLPGSWKRSENFAVGGVLYIGPLGLIFVPHRKNLRRDRSAFEMGPNASIELSLTTPKLSGLFKLLVPRPPSLLQVIWAEGGAQFLVPAPNRVLKLIDERIHEMP